MGGRNEMSENIFIYCKQDSFKSGVRTSLLFTTSKVLWVWEMTSFSKAFRDHELLACTTSAFNSPLGFSMGHKLIIKNSQLLPTGANFQRNKHSK